MSPAGGYAASLILNGTGGTPKTAFYRHDKSYVALLKIDGKTVRKAAQTDVGGLAEGIAFSPDGRYLYVGNFVDGNMDILRIDGDTLTKVANFALPEHPASYIAPIPTPALPPLGTTSWLRSQWELSPATGVPINF